MIAHRSDQEAREALERLGESVLLTAGRVISDLGPAELAAEGQQRARADIALVSRALARREAQDDRSPRMPRDVARFLEGVAEWADRPMSRNEARRLLDRSAGWTNRQKAQAIAVEMEELRTIQKELKGAFHESGLDGGWKAALQHPLYVEAEEELKRLREQMMLLI